jgi:hypothetical protein
VDWLLTGWLAFASLQGADIYTTHRALHANPGAYETNPVMRAPLPVQIAVKAGATTGLVLWSKRHPKAGRILVWSLNGLYAGVVAANAHHGRR